MRRLDVFGCFSQRSKETSNFGISLYFGMFLFLFSSLFDVLTFFLKKEEEKKKEEKIREKREFSKNSPNVKKRRECPASSEKKRQNQTSQNVINVTAFPGLLTFRGDWFANGGRVYG